MASLADLLNYPAPDFALPIAGGGSGKRLVLADLRNSFTVIHFWSAECPWSRRADLVLVYRQLAWDRLSVRVLGIACNPNEPETEIRNEAEIRHIKYPIVMDHAQDICNTYRVQTTPTFLVLDRRGVVRYVGGIDDVAGTHRLPKTIHLDKAVAAVVHDQTPNPASTPVHGTALARRSHASDTLTPR